MRRVLREKRKGKRKQELFSCIHCPVPALHSSNTIVVTVTDPAREFLWTTVVLRNKWTFKLERMRVNTTPSRT